MPSVYETKSGDNIFRDLDYGMHQIVKDPNMDRLPSPFAQVKTIVLSVYYINHDNNNIIQAFAQYVTILNEAVKINHQEIDFMIPDLKSVNEMMNDPELFNDELFNINMLEHKVNHLSFILYLCVFANNFNIIDSFNQLKTEKQSLQQNIIGNMYMESRRFVNI